MGSTILQLLAGAVAIGFIYALCALGIVLIYKSAGVVNFAQGSLVMVGAYIAYTFMFVLHLSMWLTVLLTLLTTALVGVVFQRLAYWPLRKTDVINVVISTIGVGVFLNNGVYVPWGKAPLMFPDMIQGQPLNLFGAVVPLQNATIIGVTILVLILQTLFFNRTWLGKQMQAVAQNQNTAALMGIRVPLMIALTFAYSTALGSVAGVFMAPLFYVSPNIAGVLSKAFAATVVGGFGSIPGAIVGGLFVGLVETYGAFFLSSAYKDAWAFALLIGFLLIRPQGIFGEKVAEKV